MILKKKEDIITREKYGSFFLVDITDNYSKDQCALYEINETGNYIWKCINGKRDTKELAKMLDNEIIDDIPYNIIHDDVMEFVGKLLKKGFVEIV